MNAMPPPTEGLSLVETVRRFHSDLLEAATRSVSRWPVADPASSHEDLAQEAVLRLLTRSPAAWRPRPPALRVLVAWVKRCCWRLCCDSNRRAKRRGPRASLEGLASPGCTSSALERLIAGEEAARARALLRQAYPRGAELLEAVRAQPDATVRELAERLGTSRANVHQMRSRARSVLREAGLEPG